MANSKTVRVLIVLFLGVLAFSAIYPRLGSRQSPTITPYPTDYPLLFSGITPTDITKITVQGRDGRKVSMTKIPGDWLATDESGKSIEIDMNQITKMISILPTLRYNRKMSESNLSDFGLADGGEFIVQFEAGKSYTLRIGVINADGSLSYVQRDTDDAVLQVPVQPVAQLVALVSKPVTPTPVSTVSMISTLFNVSP